MKKGFTLAEVLITLGIIGVVAAMTIPTLMVDINTRQWSTAADVFEKKLNESLKTMNTQQTISGHPTTLSFVEELAKHYKINKICQNDKLQDCFSETVYWGGGEATPEAVDMTTIKLASHFGLEDWGTELIGVQFANGVSGLIAYNPTCSGDPYSNQFEGTKCISVLYDVSGSKNPNTSGKDLSNYGTISKLGNSGCFAKINGVCLAMAPQEPSPHVWNACDVNGNSSDPEDQAFMNKYGISKCMNSVPGTSGYMGTNDYWAGAAELCGGVNRMATLSDLGKIAAYIYNKDSIGANEDVDFGASFDATKAAEAGLSDPDIYLWGRDLTNGNFNYASVRSLHYDSTLWDSPHRCVASLLAVCLGDE